MSLPHSNPMKNILIAVLSLIASTMFAGPEPVPTPVVINESVGEQFVQSFIAARSLTVAAYPSYKVDGAWGYGFAAMYPIGNYLFTSLRLDMLQGQWYAVSGTVGAKYTLDLGHNIKPTVFGVVGANSPFSGAKDQTNTVGAVLGSGVYLPIWESKDGSWTAGAFGEGEYWSQYDKILIIHGGAWLTKHF